MVGYVSHMPHAALCTRKPPESADIARFVAPWRTNNHFLGCRLSVPQTTNHQPNDNEPARIPPVGSLADCCWGTTRAAAKKSEIPGKPSIWPKTIIIYTGYEVSVCPKISVFVLRGRWPLSAWNHLYARLLQFTVSPGFPKFLSRRDVCTVI